MAWPFSNSKNRTLLGVDVGTSSLKLVALERRRGETRVASVASTPITPAGEKDAFEVATASPVVDDLLRLLDLAGLKRRAVATAVGGDGVIAKRVVVNTQASDKPAEFDAAVRTEAVRYLPFSPSEVNLDYHVIELKETGAAEILLVAVKKDRVAERVDLFRAAGLPVRVMDYDPLAVQNCYEFNYQPGPDTAVALLEVGALGSNLSVMRGSDPLFAHELGMGGQQYTDALRKECQMDLAQAEAAKRQTQPDPRVEPVRAAVLKAMRLEIRKTMDFYQAGGQFSTISAFYVTGGGAAMPGLLEMLKDEFQVAAELLDPFRRLQLEKEPEGGRAQYAVAVGLGLRGLDRSAA